ncbi:MAG TPA: DUF885 domain-containing protein [Acidimicrobiales bacterium]|nr:DUF885 domain-containing protein [Acidimicrobiales bacterium]
MNNTGHRSEIFQLANEIVERDAASDPIFATSSGIQGYDHLLPDFSPERDIRETEFVGGVLLQLQTLSPKDDIDRVGAEVMRERLESRLGLVTSGESARIFSVLSSPVSEIRQVFELMSMDDVTTIALRLAQVRPALDSWRLSLEELHSKAQLPPRRQILGVIEQARTYAEGTYETFVSRLISNETEKSALVRAARDADLACGELASWMNDTIAPSATEHDACGADRYRAWAKHWTGAELDLNELYEWGYADLQRITTRMRTIADEIAPNAKRLIDVAELLDNDPERMIEGTDELLRRLVSFTQKAVEELDGVHFDIDERIRFCDARLAPEGGAAAPYYIPPSEDLTRPGTTWFPTLGETRFSWWRHASTWYHEGVPGHHLQCATAIIEADRQSRFHRLEAWTSGYGEGWALYAERLMEELGFFDDLGDELGFLACQALRAARVVVDIGMHLELKAPNDIGSLGNLGDCGGKVWTAPMAVAVLEEMAIQSHEMSVSEVERYLGLPGQAISYKVGERVWLRSREEAQKRLGEKFSLKQFHTFALALGPMGLDLFEAELRNLDA